MKLSKLLTHLGLDPFSVTSEGMTLRVYPATGYVLFYTDCIHIRAKADELYITYGSWDMATLSDELVSVGRADALQLKSDFSDNCTGFSIKLPSLITDRLHGLNYELDNDDTAKALKVMRDNPFWLQMGRDELTTAEQLAALMAANQSPNVINWLQVAVAVQMIAPLSLKVPDHA